MSIFNSDNLTIKSEPKLTVDGIISCGGIDLPYKTEYDFTNVPNKWHHLFLQMALQARVR